MICAWKRRCCTTAKRPEPVPGCRDAQVIRDCLDVSSAACLAIAAARRHSCGYYSGSPTELQERRGPVRADLSHGLEGGVLAGATLRPDDNAQREGCWQQQRKSYCEMQAQLAAANSELSFRSHSGNHASTTRPCDGR